MVQLHLVYHNPIAGENTWTARNCLPVKRGISTSERAEAGSGHFMVRAQQADLACTGQPPVRQAPAKARDIGMAKARCFLEATTMLLEYCMDG